MPALDEFNEILFYGVLIITQHIVCSLYSTIYRGGDKSLNAFIYFQRIEISILYLHQSHCIIYSFSFLWGTTMFHPISKGK